MVLYQKIIGLATLTIVESFMLVSGIAQSWLLAAQLSQMGLLKRQDKYKGVNPCSAEPGCTLPLQTV